MPNETFYRNAAKAAWVAPLVAIGLNYANHASGQAQPPKVLFISGLIATALILTGFVSGIVALVGAGTYRRAAIIIPAVIGVSFNALVILSLLLVLHMAGKVSTANAAAQRQQQRALAQAEQDAKQSIINYGGWMGETSTSAATVAVSSLDDQSPMGRLIANELPVRCSVLAIAAQLAPGQHDIDLEPSSLSMQFTNGRIIHALNGAPILARAKDAPTLLRFNAAYHLDPAQNLYEAFALIPPGLDLHTLRSVTFLMNENAVTIRGRFVSAQEKQKIARLTGVN